MKPVFLYVIDAIVEVSAHWARIIRTKHREEQQVKRLDKKRMFAVWKEVTHWIAGHKGPTHVPFVSFCAFHFNIYNTNAGTNAYQSLWKEALQACAKAGRAEVALRAYQCMPI